MTTTRADVRQRRFAAADVVNSYGVWFVLLALLIVAGVVAPDFFNAFVLRRTGADAALLGIIAAGQALVMYTGGVDLSVAGVAVLAATVAADPRAASPLGFTAAAALLIVVAMCVGLVNTYLVVSRRVQPFVATFGMLITLEGVRVAYTKASKSGSAWSSLVSFSRKTQFGVPVLVLVWIAVVILAVVIVGRSAPGRRFLFAGSNERAAYLSGIHVTRAKAFAYCTCSLLAVLGGFLLAGRSGYVDNYTGQGTELDSITAALVGGMTFAGGEGSIVNVAGAALLLTCLYKLLIVLQLQPELQSVLQGAVLLLALAVRGLTAGHFRSAI